MCSRRLSCSSSVPVYTYRPSADTFVMLYITLSLYLKEIVAIKSTTFNNVFNA